MTTEALGSATPVVQPAAGNARARSRRRRYWVDATSQLPITVLAVCATLAFIILFNVTLHDLTTARREQIATSVPALEKRLLAEDRAFQRSIALLSAVFVACVSAGMVFLTQRSSGPIRRIQTHLERLAQDDLQHTVTLRKRDHFQALAGSCNALIAALRDRRRDDVTLLETLAADVESLRTAADVEALATKLRHLARARAATAA